LLDKKELRNRLNGVFRLAIDQAANAASPLNLA
jgi:hypothetical protein